ncbi:MAG: hypothetical protein FWD94_02815, partial [Treponema sp.]|nr:hypothetical protein [Treponema sp.]
PTVDVTAAMESANALTEATHRPEPETDREEGNPRYVNIRFRAGEYMRLKKAYGGQGFNLTTGIRKAAVYIADQIEAQAMTMTEGGIYPKRG